MTVQAQASCLLTAAECQGEQREVANLLRKTRERQGLTQQELARRLGRPQSMVARWESGEHEFTLGTLARLAEALDCPLTVRFPATQT